MLPDDELIPDGFARGLAGGFVDLPFESAAVDPQALQYDNLPAAQYDPNQDWREAQKATLQRMFGEFAPEHQEATDG